MIKITGVITNYHIFKINLKIILLNLVMTKVYSHVDVFQICMLMIM